MNQIHLAHSFHDSPDQITVKNNDIVIYQGDAFTGALDFEPQPGHNRITVCLDRKSPGNFLFNTENNTVEIDSQVELKEIIIESRYFRSLITKCGIVEVDLYRNPDFPSKHIITNILTMESSEYSIKYEYPIKKWMQVHLHGRDLSALEPTNQLVKTLVEKINNHNQ